METRHDPFLFRLMLSLPLMGLFAEWLIPLKPLTPSSSSGELIGVLYWLTGVLLLLGMFSARWYFSLVAYGLSVGAAWFYTSGEGDPLGWFISCCSLMKADLILFIQTGQFSLASSETRTLILIIGWCLLVYSVQSLALLRRSILLFALATLLYLLCLEALLGIQVYHDVIRTCGLLLVLQGMVHLSGLRESDSSGAIGRPTYSVWIFSLSIAAIIILAGGWTIGHVAEARPAERISLENAANRLETWAKEGYGGEMATAVTGYNLSGDEQDMGLPLRQGSRPYFTAESPVPTYWRGETLSNYDGRKWTGTPEDMKTLYVPGTIEPSLDEDKKTSLKHTSRATQQITFTHPMTQSFPLFGGGRIAEVLDLQSSWKAVPLTVQADDAAGTVKVPLNSGEPEVSGYRIKVDIPEVDSSRLSQDSGPDPAGVKEKYLQLPDHLPERIKELASSITASSGNRYDAVLAVENYLRDHYVYALDTKVPAEGTDFVDDFLFQTKEGYCNHFSTAMAVLLRSQGIPARYVKGFAPGKEEVGQPGRYLVNEGDAHSWVEVYFPAEGWIPFDPTPGFLMTASHEGTSAPALQSANVRGTSYFTEMYVGMKDMLSGAIDYVVKQKLLISGIIGAAILLIAAVKTVWRSRKVISLWAQLYLTRYKFPGKEQLLHASYPVWEGIARRYGAAPPGCTVREYVQSIQVEDEMMRRMMYDFAAEWEKIAYDEVPLNRSKGSAFLHQCLLIAGKLP